MEEITIDCIAPESIREDQVQVNMKIQDIDLELLRKFAMKNNIPTIIRRKTFAVNKKKFIQQISPSAHVKCTIGVKHKTDRNYFALLDLKVL